MAEWSIAAVLKTVEGHTSGGSNPSLSAIKPDNQAFVVSTPNFTPKSCKVGCFYRFLTVRAGQKTNGFNISGTTRLPITPTLPSFCPASIYWFRFSRAYIKPEPNQPNKMPFESKAKVRTTSKIRLELSTATNSRR